MTVATAVGRSVAFLALLTAVGCSRPSRPVVPSSVLDRSGLELVGRRIRGDSLPIRGARLQRAWLVTSSSDSGAVFGVQHLTRRGRDVIVFQREAARDGALPVWVITDAGYLPALPRSFRLATTCGYAEQPDPRLFAVVRNTDTEWQTDVRWAWLANIATGRIDTTATRGLRCENEGYGAP